MDLDDLRDVEGRFARSQVSCKLSVCSMGQDMSCRVPLRESIAGVWDYFRQQGMPNWGNDTAILNFQTDVLLAGSNAMIYVRVAYFIVAVFNFEKHGYEDNHTT